MRAFYGPSLKVALGAMDLVIFVMDRAVRVYREVLKIALIVALAIFMVNLALCWISAVPLVNFALACCACVAAAFHVTALRLGRRRR